MKFAAIIVTLALLAPAAGTLTIDAASAASAAAADDEEPATDPFLWLEEVEGEKALDWVKARSAKDTAELEAVPEFQPIHEELLKIYNSSERIPYVSIRGAWLYNFWQDDQHVRGLWRRTFLDQYLQDEPVWETVLDVDALAEAEGENWVFKGADMLEPEYRHALVTLSRGGSDAAVVREFDPVAKQFVKDGFHVPEAKSSVGWKDADTLWIGTDFGEGSLTTSGYPRIVKEWRRGTPLESARTVFEGSADDMAVGAYSVHTPEGRYDLVTLTPEFFRGEHYLILDGAPGAARPARRRRAARHHQEPDARLAAHATGRWAAPPIRRTRSWRWIWTASWPATATSRCSSNRRSAWPWTRCAAATTSCWSRCWITCAGRVYRLTPGDDGWQREEIPLPGMGDRGRGQHQSTWTAPSSSPTTTSSPPRACTWCSPARSRGR